MEKIYLVAQNIDYLYGRYFSSAVVIAESGEQAIQKVRDYLDERCEDDVVFDEERVRAMEIGVLTERPSPEGLGINQAFLKDSDILSMEFGEDFEP
jgi:hypothetical protein